MQESDSDVCVHSAAVVSGAQQSDSDVCVHTAAVVSGVPQSDSDVCVCVCVCVCVLFQIFSLAGSHSVLCTVSCVAEEVLGAGLFHIS